MTHYYCLEPPSASHRVVVLVPQEHHTNQTGLHGSYLWAFCSGLNSMLQPYRKALLDVEQEVTRGGEGGLVYVERVPVVAVS